MCKYNMVSLISSLFFLFIVFREGVFEARIHGTVQNGSVSQEILFELGIKATQVIQILLLSLICLIIAWDDCMH